MNKKVAFGVIVMLVLVFGSYFTFYRNENSRIPADQINPQSIVGQEEGEDLVGLFAGAGGPSKMCVFENTLKSGKTSGVIYTSETKMRGDFSVEAEGKTTESHMIVADNTSYIWEDGQSSGLKSVFGKESLSLIEGVGETADDEGGNETGNVASDGKYECSEWSVDNSFFELPKGVEFVSP